MQENTSTILIYINERLSQWAHWYIYYGDFGLGFPHKSKEGQLIEGGGLLIRSTNSYIPSNDQAEETEILVKELAAQNFKLANALREYYFGTGNMVCKARRIGMSVSHFKVYVDAAKQWLVGRLSPQKPWINYQTGNKRKYQSAKF